MHCRASVCRQSVARDVSAWTLKLAGSCVTAVSKCTVYKLDFYHLIAVASRHGRLPVAASTTDRARRPRRVA